MLVVYALYVWVIVSIVALAVQGVRRLRYDRSHRPDAVTPATEPHPLSAQQGSSRQDSPKQAAPHQSAALDRLRDGPLKVEVAPPVPDAAVAAVAVTASQATSPQAPVTAPPAQQAAPALAGDAAIRRRTLADVLTGVRLPWDLLPTVDQGQPSSDRRVSLLTTSAEPGSVGGAVADELERLGFIVAAHADDEALATRGEDVLGLRIIPDAVGAKIDGTRRFPEATERTVALDIWIRD